MSNEELVRLIAKIGTEIGSLNYQLGQNERGFKNLLEEYSKRNKNEDQQLPYSTEELVQKIASTGTEIGNIKYRLGQLETEFASLVGEYSSRNKSRIAAKEVEPELAAKSKLEIVEPKPIIEVEEKKDENKSKLEIVRPSYENIVNTSDDLSKEKLDLREKVAKLESFAGEHGIEVYFDDTNLDNDVHKLR